MNKIKLIIIAALFISFASGIVAFKTFKDGVRTFYSLDPDDGKCSVPINLLSTTTVVTRPGTFTQLSVSPADLQGACPLTKIISFL